MTIQELKRAIVETRLTDADVAHLSEEQGDDVRERWEAIGEAGGHDVAQAVELARHLQAAYPTPKFAALADHLQLLLAFGHWVTGLASWDSEEHLSDVYGVEFEDIGAKTDEMALHRLTAGLAVHLMTQRDWRKAADTFDMWLQQVWSVGPKHELARLREWGNALDSYAETLTLDGTARSLALTLSPERLRGDVLAVLQVADKALAEPHGAAALGLAALRSSSMQVPPTRRLTTGRARALH